MPRPILGAVTLVELAFLVSVKVIAPVVPLADVFALVGVDLDPVDEVVDEVLGRRRLGLALGDVVAGFSFERLVRKAPRTFPSSSWSGDWANANTVSANTNAPATIFHFIWRFLLSLDIQLDLPQPSGKR